MFKHFTNGLASTFKEELEEALDDLNINTNVVNQSLNTEKTRLDGRIDTIITSNPQPSEVVDARGGFPVLSGNLNNINSKINSLEINVKYPPSTLTGLVGSYDTGDTTKLQAIIDYAPNNSKITFPKDNYLLSKVSWTGKTLHFEFDGVTFKQNANDYIFSAKGGWEYITNVSSVSGSIITLATAQQLKAGDIIKLVSDDQLVGSAVGQKQGEFLTVKSVTGATVEVTGKIRNTYTTGIRIAKMLDTSLTMKGEALFTTDTVRGESENWNGSYIIANSLQHVKIDGVRCDTGYSSFITVESCFDYDINRIIAKDLKNDPTKLRWGYGVNDKACEGGKVRNSIFIHCRHGYTTNGDTVTAGSAAIEKFGEPTNIVVDNCRSYGSSNAGFDTHPEGYNITFSNCVGVGDYEGQDAVGAGFQTRCKKVTYINCTALNTKVGFSAKGDIAFDTDNTKMINCKVINPSGLAIDVYKGLTIEGGVFECFAGNLSAIRANCIIKNAKFIVKTSGSFRYVFDVSDNANLTTKGIEVDFTGSSGTQIRLLRIVTGSTSSVIRMDDIDVKGLVLAVNDKLTANDAGITGFYMNRIKTDLDTPTNGHVSVYAGRTSAGVPNVLPRFIGEEIFDTTNSNFYKAIGTSTSSWKLIS